MTIEMKVKELIISRFGIVSNFVAYSDIPYSTLDTMFKRGFKNSSLQTIIKLCKSLHISADALANGEIVATEIKEPTKIEDIIEQAKTKIIYNDALLFNGEPADEETIQSIIDAMEIGMELAIRKKNNAKNNP